MGDKTYSIRPPGKNYYNLFDGGEIVSRKDD